MADTVKVRLTLFQDPIEVPADEVPVLRAQGLLAEPEPEPQSEPAQPAAVTVAAKVTAPKKDVP